MDFSNISPSKFDFAGCNRQEIINNADEKECWNYSLLFDKKVSEAIQMGKKREKCIFSSWGNNIALVKARN